MARNEKGNDPYSGRRPNSAAAPWFPAAPPPPGETYEESIRRTAANFRAHPLPSSPVPTLFECVYPPNASALSPPIVAGSSSVSAGLPSAAPPSLSSSGSRTVFTVVLPPRPPSPAPVIPPLLPLPPPSPGPAPPRPCVSIFGPRPSPFPGGGRCWRIPHLPPPLVQEKWTRALSRADTTDDTTSS